MCGIIGGAWKKQDDSLKNRFSTSIKLIAHRGPDDEGLKEFETSDGFVLLGHRRLSIIDLSAAGHQPMQCPNENFTIIFNGEIYNYRELRNELKLLSHEFSTDSDTEVLLAAWSQWGLDALKRLVGMFVFVVFDKRNETLTLVRDAFGVKPLFFSTNSGQFLFSSEIKSLENLIGRLPEINTQRVYDYLVNGIQDMGTETFSNGINHLPPAHFLTINLRDGFKLDFGRWWNPDTLQTNYQSFAQASEHLRELFLESVRFHLRSDVPLGISLSGGIDSAAIACCARLIEPTLDLHTFSYVNNDLIYGEEKWIDLINKSINATPHKVRIDPTKIQYDIDDMVRTQGEPFCTPSIYAQYQVFKAAQHAGIKVVLEGQGGDELLAGYHGYQGQRMRSLLETGRVSDMIYFAREWKKWPGREHLDPWRALIGQLLPRSMHNLAERYTNLRQFPKYLDKEIFLAKGVKTNTIGNKYFNNSKGRRVIATLINSMSEGSLASLLRYGDRNAMRFSIENRVPFLTLGLAEFAISLPEEYLISKNGETKSIFRAAMRGIVPDEVLNRRDKIGFETPMGDLVQGLLKEKVINSKRDIPFNFVKSNSLKAHFQMCYESPSSFTEQDWRIFNLLLFSQNRTV